ncbi:hypothetical protein C8J56DRAFT_1023287 [Mycena floridula]|nr:hypothetical protein C8J56DRAFT_1023287 [Mycena floridula]
MPLPVNSPMSLQSEHSQPDTVHLKPKRAMIVRLSPESLKALEDYPNQPPMFFEFGDQPGIYIGDQFFSMKPPVEDIRHELYLRASTAGRLGSLKLYANITGKLEVSRKLANVSDEIRESNRRAEEAVTNRQLIVIEPPEPTTSKRKKDTGSSRKSTSRQTDQVPRPTIVSSLPPPDPGLRGRLIHCAAIGNRTAEEIVRAVGGAGCDATLRRQILTLLDEVAEKIPPPGTKATDKLDSLKCNWRLKPSAWLEVRPYEWPQLSSSDRTNLARNARLACNQLKIPESDPVWNHFRYRADASAEPSKSSTLTENPVPKKGVSKESKPKKPAKAKPADIQMRNESKPLPPKPAPAAKKVVDAASTRRTPGSGFQLKRGSSQDLQSIASPAPSAKPAADRQSNRPSVASEARNPSTTSAPLRKSLAAAEAGDSDRERHREKGDRKQMESSSKGKGKEKEKEAAATGTLKRKKPAREPDEEYDDAPARSSLHPKRRKTDGDVDRGSLSVTARPKKEPSPLPRTKPLKRETSPLPRPKAVKREASPPVRTSIKKELSPLPPASRPSHQKSASSSYPESSKNSHATAKSNGSKRRKSPIYTSSEDEGDNRNSALPTPPTVASNLSSHGLPARPRSPTEVTRAALRAKYNTKYLEQIDRFREVCRTKEIIEKLLNKDNLSDSDGDIDMLNAEAVARNYNEVREEMQNIRLVYDKSHRSASYS